MVLIRLSTHLKTGSARVLGNQEIVTDRDTAARSRTARKSSQQTLI
jgi:hypothetical protein